ncbi:MAG: avidin/streptavidin family protein [Alphaproteobacteria bacterium]
MLRTYLLAGTIMIVGLVQGWAVAAQQPLAASSVWVNELGSTMTIQTVGSDGLITGTYVTTVGCGAGKVRPLRGWYNGGAITFTVNWQECNSLTSWTGNITSSGVTIATLWQLSVSGPAQWDSIVAGADTFTLQ